MNALTISLETSSLRLVEFSSTKGRLMVQREEILFFSKTSSHRQVLTQEIQDALREIKKSWGLSNAAPTLHCIFSSDFALLRVATFEKPSHFIPTSTLVQRDAEQFLPLSLEQVSVAYQEIGQMKHDGSKTVAYAAMRTDFLEAITESISEAGFCIQKISLLPLSLYASLKASKEALLIDLAEQTLSFFLFSTEKNLCHVGFHSLGNFSSAPCEQETGLPLLLIAYLKKEIHSLIHSKGFLAPCWIITAHAPERKTSQLSLFLKKEFGIPSVVIDPCLLLAGDYKESLITTLPNRVRLRSLLYQKEDPLTPTKKTSWKRFLRIKQLNISSVNKFTAPSIAQFQKKQRSLFLIYTLGLFILLFSALSLVHDYVDNKKITQEKLKASIRLKERQLQLEGLRRDIEKLSGTEDVKKKLEELQAAHDRWPLLIGQLHKCAPPRGIWITQLTPISQEAKENKTLCEISSLEIKGLYLEGMNGEALVHECADKLATSSLFLRSKKEGFILSCSKEDGTAYAYPFSFQLPLYSPIRQ
ncbi:MAG: pilus assembly protein PilM [Chthoniobacterales bacterium]|nr:pilus assembly protein PilM [Chthoniobacterales bacterium]